MHGQNDLPQGEKTLPEDDFSLSDKWYTLEDLENRFKRSKSTINRWRRHKKLVCCKIDSVVLVNQTDLDKFMKDHRR